MKRALFRFDAGGATGFGHAMRAHALAAALEARGWQCRFAVNGDAVAGQEAPGRPVIEAVGGSEVEQADALRSTCPSGADLLVVDHYALGQDFESAMLGWAERIVVFDDWAARRHDCDVLVDPAPGRHGAYDDLVPDTCQCLTGPWYAPLRPDFARHRWRALARRRSGPIERIVISFGGTDNQRLTEPALRAIRDILPDARIEVLAGNAPSTVDMRALMGDLGLDGQVQTFIDDVAPHLADADLAIGAAGVGVWERCCLGLPSLVIPTSDNQSANVAALEEAEAATVVRLDGLRKGGDLAGPLAKLASDGARRDAMGRAAALLCDGRGAQRIAAKLDPPISKAGRPVHLRPAVMADAGLILRWQRSSKMRRYFRNPEPPSEADHRRWMTSYLAQPASQLMIIAHGADDAGMLRLDAAPDGAVMEVSILVAPEAQGSGIGTAALGLAREIWPDVELIAEVLPDNRASRSLFRKAGYSSNGAVFRCPPVAPY